MTTLTKQNVMEVQAKLNALLKKFGEENGLIIGATNAKYDPNAGSIDFKFSASTEESNPNAVDPRYLKDLRARGWAHGLNEKMIGTTFGSGEKTFEFLGMRASKIVARNASGTFLFNAEAVAPRIVAKHTA